MFRVWMLFGAIGLLLLAACIQVVPTSAPAATPTPVTPITRDRAIEIALQVVSIPWPDIGTAVENPRNPVARLMRLREFEEGYANPDTLVWVVQYEGESYSAGIEWINAVPRRQFSYAVVVIDAQSGEWITARRRVAPLF